MKQFKLSILSQECRRFMITPTTLKILSISIYETIMSNTWQAKNETCGNCIKCVVHHPKGLVVSISCTHKHKKILNSFFNVDMMTTSTTKKFAQRNNCCVLVLLLTSQDSNAFNIIFYNIHSNYFVHIISYCLHVF